MLPNCPLFCTSFYKSKSGGVFFDQVIDERTYSPPTVTQELRTTVFTSEEPIIPDNKPFEGKSLDTTLPQILHRNKQRNKQFKRLKAQSIRNQYNLSEMGTI